ncbi:MAG: aryl-sulfate sulfotransferase [Chitinophagales bacterium]|nr:aryl-sulfate sulfotransferase [Chitinophagales bacterium]
MKTNLSIAAALFVLLITAFNSNAQYSYTWPVNGSKNEFTDPNIIIRNGELIDPQSVSPDKIILAGSVSGIILADVVLSTDGKTICARPIVPFKYSEVVTVEVKDGFKTIDGSTLSGTSYSFSIRREMNAEEKKSLQEYQSTHDEVGNLINDPNQQSTYIPAPAADLRTTNFDFVNIYTNNNPAPGPIFFHTNTATEPEGYGIMESNGDSVFYRTSSTEGSNFQIADNGYLTAYKLDINVDTTVVILDSSYNQIGAVHCKNGLRASQHEHLFLPDGTKWFSIYDWQPGWDLSAYGGSTSATVNVSWIQQLDAANNVIYQWRSDLDFAVTDAAADILLTTNYVDPWHINSMFLETDGTMIVSLRNMDMIFKLKPSNNSIVWYWGASTNYFPNVTTLNDPDGLFSHPHNTHRIANGNIFILDNGNLHTPPVTQPKEYTLNETTLVASCIWWYSHPQVNGFNMYTKQQGNATRMLNGNTLIGYGLPSVLGLYNGTEIDLNNNIVWEFRFKDSTEYSYRVNKYEFYHTGIAAINKVEHINVFPNPSTGIVSFDIEIAAAGKVNVAVSNILGQQVFTQTENYGSGIHKHELDLSKLEKGFYLLSITAGEKKMTDRILIQ